MRVAAPSMQLVCDPEDPRIAPLAARFECVTETDALPGALYLRFDGTLLSLCRAGEKAGVAVHAADIERRLRGDFTLYRAVTGASRKGAGLRVLDAMAGLGIDGLALARHGCRVTLVERNPVLWALLDDALRRLALADVDLVLGDCRTLLERPAQDQDYDVVYLDPMFPERAKRALPGKRMQYLGTLLRESETAPDGVIDLVRLARSRARSRVVLKRRRKDPVLLEPDWQIAGRSVRYDVYRGTRDAQPSRRIA